MVAGEGKEESELLVRIILGPVSITFVGPEWETAGLNSPTRDQGPLPANSITGHLGLLNSQRKRCRKEGHRGRRKVSQGCGIQTSEAKDLHNCWKNE